MSNETVDPLILDIDSEAYMMHGSDVGRYPHLIIEPFSLASYELEGDVMRINDPVWGKCEIGGGEHDAVLMELARTPVFRRLQAIEQLTLSPAHATMPNTNFISRWQHIWGSVVFVRKMIENNDDISPRQGMELQLRTLLSDVGHTAFSHLGDWLFDKSGKEDLHDKELKDYLDITGVTTILTKHGFSLDEVVFPEISDWVEADSPMLCVDRVDYGLREILRWVDVPLGFLGYKNDLQNPQSLFEIQQDGHLAITDENFARMFAAGFSILATEHWSHPVHRLQLELLQLITKKTLLDMAYTGGHPRDMLFATDGDITWHFQEWENIQINKIMERIAIDQRNIFHSARRSDLSSVFQEFLSGGHFPEFPEPLKPYSWESEKIGLPYPTNIVFEKVPSDVSVDPYQVALHGLQVYLPALKPRSIDPRVRKESGGTVVLSELDESYPAFLEGQSKVMKTAYVATLLVRKEIIQSLVEQHVEADEEWNKVIHREREPKKLAKIVADSEFAGAGRRFDIIREV